MADYNPEQEEDAIIMAEVDVGKDPALGKRFAIADLPGVILFKGRKVGPGPRGCMHGAQLPARLPGRRPDRMLQAIDRHRLPLCNCGPCTKER